MADYSDPSIYPVAQKVKFSNRFSIFRNINKIYFGIIFIILLLVVGIFVLTNRLAEDEEISSQPFSVEEASKSDFEKNYEIFANSSESFKQSIINIYIPDLMMEDIRNNPDYLGDGTYILKGDYDNLDTEAARYAFKDELTREIDAIAKEAKEFYGGKDFSSRLGNLLEIIVYVASLSKSPHLNESTKVAWDSVVNEGKRAVADLLVLMGPEYKDTTEKWINENIYSREEFK